MFLASSALDILFVSDLADWCVEIPKIAVLITKMLLTSRDVQGGPFLEKIFDRSRTS